jgi:Flp pilus assembly protein TadD
MDYTLLLVAVAFVVMLWRILVLRSRGPKARAAFQRGIDALNANAMNEAEAAFREVVRLEPIWALAYRLLGRILADRGETEEAEKNLRAAVTLEPRNSEAYADLGFFLTIKVPDRRDEAISAFAKAIELAPRLRETLANTPALSPLLEDERFRQLLD